jgi:hypothetical protein
MAGLGVDGPHKIVYSMQVSVPLNAVLLRLYIYAAKFISPTPIDGGER